MSFVPSQAPEPRRQEAVEEHGRSYPLGASLAPGGVNFSIFSRGATGVELLLFDRGDDVHPSRVISLDPDVNRSYFYWHTFAPDVPRDRSTAIACTDRG